MRGRSRPVATALRQAKHSRNDTAHGIPAVPWSELRKSVHEATGVCSRPVAIRRATSSRSRPLGHELGTRLSLGVDLLDWAHGDRLPGGGHSLGQPELRRAAREAARTPLSRSGQSGSWVAWVWLRARP